MNTPTHVAVSLLVWRRETQWRPILALVSGACLPDLPMFGFYGYQKFVGRHEGEIWGQLYFDPTWQWIFDIFNSIPLAIVLWGLCYWTGFRCGVLFAASALVHVCCDLPVHHDDAHRHFLPLANWRFTSPVSYWDPNHHGQIFAPLELLFTITSCCYLAWRATSAPMRITALATLGLCGFGLTYALVVWIL